MMKRRSLILVGFLLVLYIVPLISISSYGRSTIPTQPSINKDFSLSETYEYSSESITSFSETLPGDVLFYPDALNLDIRVADSGDTAEYNKSQVKDYVASPFDECVVTGDGTTDELYYTPDIDGRVESFDYAIYGFGDGTGTVKYWDNGWQSLETITSEDWYNGSVSLSYPTREVRLQLSATGGHDLYTDYVQIQIALMTFDDIGTPVLSSPYFATGGDTGYDNTYAVDSVNFSIAPNAFGVLEFSYDPSNMSSMVSFTYAIYGVSVGSCAVFYSSDNIDYGSGPFDVITYEGWYNGTHTTDALENTGIGYVLFDYGCDIDYMEISFTYRSISAYGESFSDISDWQLEIENVPSESFTTDGDIATLEIGYDDTGNEYGRYNTSLQNSALTDYIEFRWISSPSAGSTLSTALTIYLDDIALGAHAYSAGWTTTKILVSDYCSVAPTTLAIHADDWANSHASDTGYVKLDYIRIGPSNEMGWQHDGSLVEGITTAYPITSDGNEVTLTNNVSGVHAWDFYIDTTSTLSKLDLSYYPLLEMSVTGLTDGDSDGNCWLLRAYESSGTYENIKIYGVETGILRYNVASLSIDEVYRLRVYLQDENDSITINYMKFYSIADFSYVAGGGESTNDYSYVEDEKLIVHTDTYTKWNHDPTLSVTIATYDFWSATIEGDDSGFRFRELLDTNTLWNQGITNGTLVGTTFEDFDLLLYSNCNISAVNFYGIVPSWQIITDVDIVFFVSGWHIISSVVITFVTELSSYALNLIFLFLGLAMIPTSTILLVKGGRDEMSTDKLLVVILCFFMGWALFLGGIFA